MSSTWTKLENSTGEIKVSCMDKMWQDAQEKAFKKLAQKVKVPGFRSGKAPLDLIRKQIDEQNILIEAVESVAGELLLAALKQHEIDLVARPELSIDRMSKEVVDFTFKCTIKPDVVLGEYKNVVCIKDEVKVDEKEIDEQIDHLKENFAELALKETGTVNNGDTVVLDFKGLLNDVAFEGGTAENYNLEVGSGSFIPGFEEQLIGLKSGESKDIDVTFPQDYQAEDLAGKPVVFKVDIKEIKEKILPIVDDEFAKNAGVKDVTNLAELRQSIYDNLKTKKAKETEDKFRNELFDLITSDCQVEIPQIMIDDEKEYMYQDFINRLARQGYNEELYFQITGMDKEAMMLQYSVDAESKVKLRLVLEAIAKKEEIVVESSEVETEYQNIAESYQRDIEEIKKSIEYETLELDIKLKKAMDIVVNSAVK